MENNIKITFWGGYFSDGRFHNLGVKPADPSKPDEGRYAITKDKADMGAFKTPPGSVVGPAGNTNGTNNKTFYRYGATGSFNWQTLNLQIMYMKGIDDKAFNTLDPTKNYNYSGGFVELDYAGMLNNRLIASGVYNWIMPPSYDSNRDLKAYSVLLRYYIGHWSAVNIAMHEEYTYRVTGKAVKLNENMFILGLDFALYNYRIKLKSVTENVRIM